MFNNQGPLWVSINALLVLQEEPFPQILPSDSDAFMQLELMNVSWALGMDQVL